MVFSLATGLRKSDVAKHEKIWINRDLRITTIPGQYYKNKKAHVVPLNDAAMWVIEQVWNDHDKYLFTYPKRSRKDSSYRVPIKELNTKAWLTH